MLKTIGFDKFSSNSELQNISKNPRITNRIFSSNFELKIALKNGIQENTMMKNLSRGKVKIRANS